MAFPVTRMRRLRATPGLRGLVRETELRADRLVAPLFVSETATSPEPVRAMPGVFRLPLADAVEQARVAAALGLGAVMLFGIPAEKDAEGSGAWDEHGIVQLAVRAIKQALPRLVVITDVCLCEYTEHGHCGVLDLAGPGAAEGTDAVDGAGGAGGDLVVDNDATLELLARTAVSHARAGADVVAPSDMMDGRVGAIRAELDEQGFSELPILAYSTKFASAFYGPFREAAGSTPSPQAWRRSASARVHVPPSDRRSYQLDPGNGREALREALLDVAEGADMLMVKPALAYGDLIAAVKRETRLPVAAYNVSGEYAMVKAAAAAGHLDERATVCEILTSLHRAGADIVISYHAKDVAQWLSQTA